MTWDQLRSDVARALAASGADDAEMMMARLERAFARSNAETVATNPADDELLRQLVDDLDAAFPDRSAVLLRKIRRVLAPERDRVDPTVCVSLSIEPRSGVFPSLTVVRGPELGRRFELRRERAAIGRARSNDFVLADGCVSRRHFEIFVDRGAVFVTDQRSTNGTWINGTRIPALSDVPLRGADVLILGATALVFEE